MSNISDANGYISINSKSKEVIQQIISLLKEDNHNTDYTFNCEDFNLLPEDNNKSEYHYYSGFIAVCKNSFEACHIYSITKKMNNFFNLNKDIEVELKIDYVDKSQESDYVEEGEYGICSKDNYEQYHNILYSGYYTYESLDAVNAISNTDLSIYSFTTDWIEYFQNKENNQCSNLIKEIYDIYISATSNDKYISIDFLTDEFLFENRKKIFSDEVSISSMENVDYLEYYPDCYEDELDLFFNNLNSIILE